MLLLSLLLFEQAAASLSCKMIFTYQRNLDHQVSRSQLINDYANKSYRTKEQNQSWIDAAMKEQKPGLYVELTTSQLKKLNDSIIKNKDLVTGLVNLRKDIDLQMFSPILSMKGVEIYSDYKTLRFYIPVTGQQKQRLIKELELTFERAEHRFTTQLLDSGLVRKSDLKENWFQMGIAESADLASYTARKASDLGLTHLELISTKNKQKLQEDLNRAHEQFEAVKDFKLWDYIFSETTGSLHLRTVEIFRKNRQPHSLAKALEEAFGYKVSHWRAQQLIDFFLSVDLFSPSLIIAERTSVAIEKAPYGAFSLDFIGLGAKNLLSTINAVLSTRSADRIMEVVREKEQEVTLEFNQQKELVRQRVDAFFRPELQARQQKDPIVRFSGDEGIIIAPRFISIKDMIELQKELLDIFGLAQLRMTFMPSNKQMRIETDIVSLAEGIEKQLKKRLTPKIDPEILSQIQFNIFASHPLANTRTLDLMLYSTQPHSKAQREYIREAFADVVISMNAKDPSLNIKPGYHVYGDLPN